MYRSPLGMMVRGPDRYAADGGGWHARRSTEGRPRLHEGIDLVTFVGQSIVAPVACHFLRIADPYPDKRDAELLGAMLVDSSGTKIKVLYLDPINEKVGHNLAEGEVFGYAQSLQKMYPGITDHVHVEIWTSDGLRVDPRPYFLGLSNLNSMPETT